MADEIKAKASGTTSPPRRVIGPLPFVWLFLRAHVREWFVLLCVAIGVLAAVLYVSHTPKRYRASAQIFVTTKQLSGGALASGQTFVQSQMQSYVSIVTSPFVLYPVLNNHVLDLHGGFVGEVSADAPLDQSLLNVHVDASSATRAAAIANAVAAQTIVVIEQLQSSAVQLTVIHSAVPPSGPVAPRKDLILIVGVLAGLMTGLILVISLERATQRIRSPRDVEATTDLPLLGAIPDAGSSRSTAIVSTSDVLNARRESFSQLRSSLQFVNIDQPPKVLAVVSARPGEGKSSVALNLALDLADVGFNVCLVDADLRRASLARMLSIDSQSGLTTLLVPAVGAGGQLSGLATDVPGRPPPDGPDVPAAVGSDGSTGEETIVARNLSVITAGPLPPNPGNLLASRQFRAVIGGLRERFDYVILDSASLLTVADGAEVVVAADAALLVIRARVTTRNQLSASLRVVERSNGSVAGIVLYRTLPAFMGGFNRRFERRRLGRSLDVS